MPRTMDLETVNLTRRGGELRIELARPEAMNAWNTQLGEDLLAAVELADGVVSGLSLIHISEPTRPY